MRSPDDPADGVFWLLLFLVILVFVCAFVFETCPPLP